jgi:hypothetical protein
MKLQHASQLLLGLCAMVGMGIAQAQSTGLSYSGYSIGHIHTTRATASDTAGINFSGSFKINDTFFAAANVAAQKAINGGKIGVGFHVPAPVDALKNVDLYAIAGVARNTNYNTGWGPTVSAGAKTMLSPQWELNFQSAYTDLNTTGHERETSLSLGYLLTRDLIVRARSFRATNSQGYELAIGSHF